MSQRYVIPEDKQDDVMFAYWIMLRQIEGIAEESGCPLDQLNCESFYNLWNEVTGENPLSSLGG